MDNISTYISSFLRLQHDIARTIKLSKLNDGTYRLSIYSEGPHGQFLPDRITESITEVVLKLSPDWKNYDLSCYTNLKRITVETTKKHNDFILSTPPELELLSLEKAKTNQLFVKGLVKVTDLRIRVTQNHILNSIDLVELGKLLIQLEQEDMIIDMSQLQNLYHLSIKGNLNEKDSIQLEKLKFPRQIKSLHLHFLMTRKIDISYLLDLEIIKLTQIRSPPELHKPRDLIVEWPSDRYNQAKLKIINCLGVTFEADPLEFDGERFPCLEYLELESHMNREIRLFNLSRLNLFKTSLSRYIIGHQVQLYFVNCPNLTKVRTAHRMMKYVWNCPDIIEFGQNRVELDELPDWVNRK